MKIYKYPDQKKWKDLVNRPSADYGTILKQVQKIIADVKSYGDRALQKYTELFDKIKLTAISVSQNEINDAENGLNDDIKKAIKQAKRNIEIFHKAQKEKTRKIKTMPGISCWRKSVGIEKVGIYVPGGSAPLFSTVIMLAVPAKLAGCKEIILCTPPGKNGLVHPAILYTAKCCGVKSIYKVGGAQAIAAMAFGTDTIPKVFKIFGPGNQYVTMAKQALQQIVAIDMPAGPSELLVIADETANVEYVASDLLSQAEHGSDSQVILLTTKERFAKDVLKHIDSQIKDLPRKDIAIKVLKNSKIVLLNNINDAINFSNLYAPEHLIFSVKNVNKYLGKIISAGSVFIGNYSPESAGDYASGTNHTLPTNAYAAAYSGVSLDSFVKKITYQKLTKKGLKNIADTVMIMAETEQLIAHKNAIEKRFNKRKHGI